jgi:hypothetical protein
MHSLCQKPLLLCEEGGKCLLANGLTSLVVRLATPSPALTMQEIQT